MGININEKERICKVRYVSAICFASVCQRAAALNLTHLNCAKKCSCRRRRGRVPPGHSLPICGGKYGTGCAAIQLGETHVLGSVILGELELRDCGALARAESQGFHSLPALTACAGDRTLSELIKVNHD